MNIILTTLNARYTHTSIALRYLFANLHEFKENASIQEYTINDNIHEIAEKIIKSNPSILGIGVYIWNSLIVSELINIIKKILPNTIIILGGPEVSYEPYRVDFSAADYIIKGEGEESLYYLIKDIFNGKKRDKSIIESKYVELDSIVLPYEYYNDHDISNRIIYVEASRGCPFRCEFCLSSIDKKVRDFPIETLLGQFELLWEKGARNFKFIDRTFNLNINKSIKILNYFLGKNDDYLIHFEVIPEHFPQEIRDKIKKFKPGTIQLEVGIQTLNPEIAERINRPMNFNKIKDNLEFLENETKAHLHVDLIIGLPGESIMSFSKNLNTLGLITNCEIQLGVLKKLSGTTLCRHDIDFEMIYSDIPPYEILSNSEISYLEMQELKRFTRYWDLCYNSGNFKDTIKYLWMDGDIYNGFNNFSLWLYKVSSSTHNISLNRLTEYLYEYLTSVINISKNEVSDILIRDLTRVDGRKIPLFLKENATFVPQIKFSEKKTLGKRQERHKDS
ncbi:MAG: DUF4080 domain-containing protein [Spirochaetales bacterium]|nr:DUF4080 domain-containing protein [Spirochaetales bacterium]